MQDAAAANFRTSSLAKSSSRATAIGLPEKSVQGSGATDGLGSTNWFVFALD